MISRFYSYEDAAIHVGVMRSLGHDAVVLDEAMGVFYGPVFSNGFRVWVSDEAVTDPEEPAEDPPSSGKPPAPAEQGTTGLLMNGIRLIVGALMATGLVFIGLALAACVIKILWELRNAFVVGKDAEDLASALALLLGILGGVAFFTFIGPLMEAMTGSLRDERSVFGWVARSIAVLWVGAELLWLGAMLVQVLWRMCGGAPVIPMP